MEKKKNKKIWVVILIVTVIVVGAGTIIGIFQYRESNKSSKVSSNKSIKTTSNTSKNQTNYNKNTSSEKNVNKKILENPYTLTNEYDGAYYFKFSSNTLTTKGVVIFNNGICNIQYDESKKYDGFCGLNENDNNAFYFMLTDNNDYKLKTFRVNIVDGVMSCQLVEGTDLNNKYSSSKFDIIYMGKIIDAELAYSQMIDKEKKELQQEQERKEKEFKSECKTYTYEQLARNPEKYIGVKVKLTGEVVQTLYGSNSVDMRVDITKKGTYSTYYTDTIYAVYDIKQGEDKILEDDIITMYGTCMGEYSYTSVMGAKITLPLIKVEYLELKK